MVGMHFHGSNHNIFGQFVEAKVPP